MTAEKARKRAVRERASRTGESYTAAARALAAGPPDLALGLQGHAASWSWPMAVARLTAMAEILALADEVISRLEEAQAHASKAGRFQIRHRQQMSEPGSLVDALGHIEQLELLVQARREHLSWYGQQAYACLDACAAGAAAVPPLLSLASWRAAAAQTAESSEDRAGEVDGAWHPPAGAFTVADAAGSAEVQEALSRICEAEQAAAEMDAQIEDRREDWLSSDQLDEMGSSFSPGPAEHQIDAWAQMEDAAADYWPAVREFCRAMTALIARAAPVG